MKIKTVSMNYDDVMVLPRSTHFAPVRPNIFFRSLIRLITSGDLKDAGFTFDTHRMELVGGEPCLILMNHSSFIDLEIVSRVMYPKPYCIVCTSDGFVGKPWLMRQIGCIPTRKFVRDVTLLSDMEYALKKLKTSVLMYPEASYTFDGRATPLPKKLGFLLKKLDVPVVSIITEGAFARDPLYNCLQKRKVTVHADVSCFLTREEIKQKSTAELDKMLNDLFTFDNFAWQQEKHVKIGEPFRADGLERILFRCPHCGGEGTLAGRGITLRCDKCGAEYELDEYGAISRTNGESAFTHIPDWYEWERGEVRRELEAGEYKLECGVSVGVMVDYKAIYMVGDGVLRHDGDGFALTGCGGKLDYHQSPLASYSLYSDYYWYELGDIICIGDNDVLYYCFPKGNVPVAKARMAAEELYKMKKASLREKLKAKE